MHEILICLFNFIQQYFIFFKTVKSWTTSVLDRLILPFRIPSSVCDPQGFYSTCFFMNHLGNFPRVLNHSQKAEEMLKRVRERLLGGSEECQRRSGNIKSRKTKLQKYQGWKRYFVSLFYPFFLAFFFKKKHLLLSR